MPIRLLTRASAEAFALAAAAIASIVVVRAVGPAVAGELAVATTTFYLATVFANGGLPTAAAQEVASAPAAGRSVVRAVTLLRLVYSLAFLAVAEGVVALLPIGSDLRALLRLTLLGVLLIPARNEWILVATGAVGRLSVSRVAAAMTTLVAAVLIVRFPGDVTSRAVFVLAAHLGAAVATTVLARSVQLEPQPQMEAIRATNLARAGTHYLRADVSIFVYNNSDRLFLYAFGGAVVVGLYDAAYKIIQPFSAVGSVVGDSTYLALAQARGTGALRRVYRRYLDLMFFATVPAGPFLVAFGPAFVSIVYGERFAGAGLLIGWLGWVVTFGYLSGALAIPFSAWRLPRAYGNAIMAGSIANLAFNVILVPPLLGIGAAVATVLAKLAVVIASIRPFRGAADYPVFRDFGWYLAISSVAAAAGLLLVRAFAGPPLWGVPIAGLIYLGGLAVARRRRDITSDHEAVLEG